jgi:hypothetical protein
LNDYIINTLDLVSFIEQIAGNPRANMCLEGYYPRRHNKRIVDGLTEYIQQIIPDFEYRDANKYRAPTNSVDNVLNCGTNEYVVYESYNGSTASTATMKREGGAYRAGPGPSGQYKYGKSCMLSNVLTDAERDVLLNTAPYISRKHYPCKCFQSKKTCEDFSEGRNNRVLRTKSKVGKSTVPYCTWEDGRCN